MAPYLRHMALFIVFEHDGHEMFFLREYEEENTM